jgi:hypothetical protein
VWYAVYTTCTPPRTFGPLWLVVASRAIRLEYEDLPHLATLRHDFPRIAALEEVAGSSPVGHPVVFGVGKPDPRK